MLEPSCNNQLPLIPLKRYFTIGEVSELCAVKPHVLRYWEQEFEQLSPIKKRGNRRYYRHKDVLLVRKISSLLHDYGFTINGARQQLLLGQNIDEILNPQVIEHLISELESLIHFIERE